MANTITASFGLNLNPLKAAAKSAKSIGAGLGSSFTSLVGPLAAVGAAIGAAFGAKKFADGVKGALDLGGALSDVAAQTGIAAGKAYELQEQMQDNGVAAEEFSGIINKMQKTLVAPAGRQAIKNLGLSFAEISQMTPDAQFVAIGKAIGKISDPTKKTAAAMSIFGKSGAGLLASFADSAFGNADATLSKQAEILNRDAETFDAASDRLGKVTRPLKGFFLGVASTVATTLIPILDKIIATDLVGIGKVFGAGMTIAAAAFMGAFSDPATAISVITDGLIAGFLTAGNYLIGIFEFLAKLVSDKGFWEGLLNVFLGLEFIVSGALMKGFNTPLKFFQDSMQFIVEKTLAGLDKLNPFSEASKEAERIQVEFDKANEGLIGRESFQMPTMGGMGGASTVTIPGRLAETDPVKRRKLEIARDQAAKELARLKKGTTFADIQAANKGEELTVGGLTADQLIAQGKTLAGQGGTNIMASAMAAFRGTKVTDQLGAGAYAAKTAAGFNVLRAQGAEFMGPPAPGAAAGIAAVQRASAFNFGQSVLTGRGEQGIGSRGGLVSRGLQGMSATSLKPLAVETPATPADKAAIDNAKNSGDLLTEFKNLVAAWTH
jgi:hypothetical protein